jgi:hypothetical protein
VWVWVKSGYLEYTLLFSSSGGKRQKYRLGARMRLPDYQIALWLFVLMGQLSVRLFKSAPDTYLGDRKVELDYR